MSNTENLANVAKHIVASSSGNVGVGTTSTGGYRLAVVGSAASSVPLYLHSDATNGYVYSPNPLVIGSTGAYALSFATNNTVRALIDSSGVVQVGGTTVANTVGYVNSRTNTRAWARWNGTNGVITSSYNVSSVTRNSTGDYTVAYTTALADANYAILTSGAGDTVYGGYGMYVQIKAAPTTTGCGIITRNGAGTYADQPSVQIAVFGN